MKLLIIPDGNRRWAAAHGLDIDSGYRAMAAKLGMTIDFFIENGIPEAWVLGNSVRQRLERPEKEVRSYWNHFLTMLNHTHNKSSARIMVAGNRNLFFGDYGQRFENLEINTARHEGLTLHLLLNYSGFGDVARKAAGMLANGQEINAEALIAAMDIPQDLSVILKTGADERNYICGVIPPYYTMIHFTDKLWPDIERADLEQLLQDYGSARKNL